MNRTRQIIYIVLGTVFLILGTIGIFVPLLPTTPFWLLTSWFYIRSSTRLYNKVMSNKYFGSYVRSYMVDKAIPMRSKVITLVIMWGSILATCIFLVDILWVRIVLILISAGVTWHILSFPTRKAK